MTWQNQLRVILLQSKIDDDLSIDQEKINEERRAYLEEARSQEASD